LEGYQNTAIRDTIKDAYLKSGDAFGSVMPEMVKTAQDLVITAGVFNNPTDAWIILEVAAEDDGWYATRIVKNLLKVKAGRDAMLNPTAAHPAFYQTALTTVILPASITGEDAIISYIPQLDDMVAGDTLDIPLSPYWDGEIVERMVQMGLADAKSSVAI